MSVAQAGTLFLAGTGVALLASWVLVSRLERLGERLGLSEGLLGIVAALSADTPEITTAVTALARHQQKVGAGVIIGSNVFNLAALLGLGALVAGRIALHHRVVLLGGGVAVWVAGVALVVVLGLIVPVVGLVVALVPVVCYVAVLGAGRRGPTFLPLPQRWTAWLARAVAEEEFELEVAIRPTPGGWRDGAVAGASLAVVVAASVTMERSGSKLGSHLAVPPVVLGSLVLAGVTSLPNAVSAVYLAARGRGAAVLSTALNSNTINVAVGLLLPASVIGMGAPSGQTTMVACWYVGMTLFVLALTYLDYGLRRYAGALIVIGYLTFFASVLAMATLATPHPSVAIGTAAAGMVVVTARIAAGRRTRHG